MKADLDLVREVKAGNKAAFADLVRRHQKSLYRLALRFTRDHGTAEDIVQESFVKAYQKLDSFEERSSFKSWLFRIAINTSKNRLRATVGAAEVDIQDVVLSVAPEVEANIQYRQIQSFISTEVQKLPERQRIALTLRVFEDLSFQEIAEMMACPYDTAKANYRHAIIKLKKALMDAGLTANLNWLPSNTEEVGAPTSEIENDQLH